MSLGIIIRFIPGYIAYTLQRSIKVNMVVSALVIEAISIILNKPKEPLFSAHD